MSRAEKFALLTGIIGLVADLAALTVSALTLASGNTISGIGAPVGVTTPDLLRHLGYFLLIYSWFTISWFLVRRYFLYHTRNLLTENTDKKSHTDQFALRAMGTIAGMGLIIYPIGLLLEGWFIVAPLLVGPIIWVTIAILMPVIYTEMDFPENIFFSTFREKALEWTSPTQAEVEDRIRNDLVEEIADALFRVLTEIETWQVGYASVFLKSENHLTAYMVSEISETTNTSYLITLGWEIHSIKRRKAKEFRHHWVADEDRDHLLKIADNLVEANIALGLTIFRIPVKLSLPDDRGIETKQ